MADELAIVVNLIEKPLPYDAQATPINFVK